MAQVFLYPAPDQSPLDEDGNPFPSTGLRVTMNAYYEGQCRQGLLVRRDPNAFSSVAQPAVYAPFDIGYVTNGLDDVPVTRDGRYLTTVGNGVASDGAGDFFVGLGSGGAVDGYRVISGSSGNWQRANVDASGRINLKKFGCKSLAGVGTPDNYGPVSDFMEWALGITGTSGPLRRRAIGVLPNDIAAYYLSNSIKPPGTNHDEVTIIGEGWYSDNSNHYGDPVWDDPTTTTGSVFLADPGKDVFLLENTGATPGENYHRLRLENLAMVATGAGYGINYKIPSTPGDWQVGRVNLSNVRIQGAKVGMNPCGYEKSTNWDLSFRGCETGLMLGSKNGAAVSGLNLFSITGLDLQSCTYGIEVVQILHNALIQDGNIQGILQALYRFQSGANGLGLVLQSVRHESYTRWVDIDPAVTQMGIVWRDCSLSSDNGSAAPNGPVHFYGSGWTFDRMNDVSVIDFTGSNDPMDMIFRDCRPRTTNQASAPLRFWSISCDNVLYRQDNAAIGAGTFTPTWPSGFITRELNGNITIAVPTGGYVIGKEYVMSFYQGGAGGYTITWAAGWHGDAAYSNAGNAFGTRCWIYWRVQINGEPYVTKVTNWTVD